MAIKTVQLFECDYCSATFKTKSGLNRHMCKKKALAQDIGDLNVRNAYKLFSFWYTYNGFRNHSKTYPEFLKSPYFSKFIEVTEYVSSVYLPNGREYVRWCVDNNISTYDWVKDKTLKRYQVDYNKKNEPVSSAIRSLEAIATWCEQKEIPIEEFFKSIKPTEALIWIQNGRLNPWVLFSTGASDVLLNKFSEDQLVIMNETLDLDYWTSRLKVSREAVNEVANIMDQLGMIDGETTHD
jgi:hypothetical protein